MAKRSYHRTRKYRKKNAEKNNLIKEKHINDVKGRENLKEKNVVEHVTME